MFPRNEVTRLSHTQCEFLIRHIDTTVPICNLLNEPRTRKAMLEKRYIRYEPANAVKPKATVLTELGREMVCAICDFWLESLLKARPMKRIGYGLMLNIQEILHEAHIHPRR